MLAHSLRGHLAEFGIVAPRGLHKVEELIAAVGDEADRRIPARARSALQIAVLAAIDRRITMVATEIVSRTRTDPVARRLALLPGIGPIIGSRTSGMVPDPSIFRSDRDFAAWIGRAPRQYSTGGKARLGGISKRGNGSLRRLLAGAPWPRCSARNSSRTIPGFASFAPASPR